jgi:formamidopyrimidine-DNA glycosylase
VHCPNIVRGCSANDLAARLKNRTIRDIGRRGKFIVFRLAGKNTLLIHLRMTGQFTFAAAAAPRGRHEHLVLTLDDGRELRYQDTRKFGRWQLTPDPERALQHLGPEPLADGFRSVQFAARLAAHHRMLKPLLLDQSFLAGLGNIYTDEALWEARLHPRRRANTVRPAEARALFRAIRKVLRQGIRDLGTSLGSGAANFANLEGQRGEHQQQLRVYQQTGAPCHRCGAPIRRTIVGQRSTHFCPDCQSLTR